MKIASLFLCLFLVTSNMLAQSVPPQQDGSLFSLEAGNLFFAVDSTYGHSGQGCKRG